MTEITLEFTARQQDRILELIRRQRIIDRMEKLKAEMRAKRLEWGQVD